MGGFFTFEGRLTRLGYLWKHILLQLALTLFCVFFALLFIALAAFGAGPWLGITALIGMLLFMAALYIIPAIAFGVRRLHDMNLSGWFILIPAFFYFSSIGIYYSAPDQSALAGVLISLFLFSLIVLLVWPGTKGSNRFGSEGEGINFGNIENLGLWYFLFSIPVIGALAHDIWLAWFADEEELNRLKDLDISVIKPEGFHLSDLGYIWTQYSPDSFNQAREGISPEVWKNWIDPVLEQSTVVVMLVPLAILILYVFLVKFVQSGQGFSGGNVRSIRRKAKKDFGVYDAHNKGRLKFKRK